MAKLYAKGNLSQPIDDEEDDDDTLGGTKVPLMQKVSLSDGLDIEDVKK